MATVKCRDCGKEVSTKADKCPHCGRSRKRTSVLGKLILIGFALWLIGYFLPGTSSKAPTNSPAVPSATPAVTSTVKPIPAPSPKENALKSVILNYKWSKSAGGSAMEADFTILNQSEHAIKDVKITCTHYGQSGTKIDSNTRTIYEVFPARKSKTVKNFSMGFIHSQAHRSSCEVVDLDIM